MKRNLNSWSKYQRDKLAEYNMERLRGLAAGAVIYNILNYVAFFCLALRSQRELSEDRPQDIDFDLKGRTFKPDCDFVIPFFL